MIALCASSVTASDIPKFRLQSFTARSEVCAAALSPKDNKNPGLIVLLCVEGERDLKKAAEIISFPTPNPELRTPNREISLPDETAMVDLADVDGDGFKDLVAFHGANISVFHQRQPRFFDSTPQDEFSVPSIVPLSTEKPIFRHVMEDLTGDGLPELVLPRRDSYWVFFNRGGRFSEENSRPLGEWAKSRSRMEYRTGQRLTISYRLPEVMFWDLDGDGVKDLALNDMDRFAFYMGTANGEFPIRQSKFDVPRKEIRFLSDKQRVTEAFIFSELRDLDGDGTLDIMMYHLSESKDIESESYIFFGKPDCQFSDKPLVVSQAKRQAVLPFYIDINGDGRKDLLTAKANLGVGFLINYFFKNRITLNATANLLEKDQRFSRKVSFSRNISFEVPPRMNLAPVAAVGDFNGDKCEDFAFGINKDRVGFYFGTPEGKLTDMEAAVDNVDVYGEALVNDIDGDGRAELLIYYPSGQERKTVNLIVPE